MNKVIIDVYNRGRKKNHKIGDYEWFGYEYLYNEDILGNWKAQYAKMLLDRSDGCEGGGGYVGVLKYIYRDHVKFKLYTLSQLLAPIDMPLRDIVNF